MNILGDLLRIKEFRQDKAELEVARTREEVELATQTLTQARQTLAQYRIDCDVRERALYADLCSREVQLADIDDVKLECDLMRDGIARHEQAVAEAEAERKAAVEKLEQARLDYQAATRNREKFFELDMLSGLERLQEAARAEDLEMEEVVTKPPVHTGDEGTADAGRAVEAA